MTIETTLQVELGGNSYTLMTKMIRIEPSSYFFIRDINGEKPLLSGKTLELTYVDSFSLTEFGGEIKTPGIPEKVIAAVQQGIMKKSDTWFLGK